MTTEQIAGVVRALLAFAGGILVSKGMVDSETVATVAGAGATIAVAVWSFMSKKAAE
jgi:hypothetical protein